MTKQEEIREGLARRMFDSEMSRDQVFGVATREKAWLEERENYLSRAFNDLHYLHSQGVVIKSYSLGISHPHLAAYYAVEPLVKETKDYVKQERCEYAD